MFVLIEDALREAEAAFQAAQDYLEEAKNTIPEGNIWWMNRVMFFFLDFVFSQNK